MAWVLPARLPWILPWARWTGINDSGWPFYSGSSANFLSWKIFSGLRQGSEIKCSMSPPWVLNQTTVAWRNANKSDGRWNNEKAEQKASAQNCDCIQRLLLWESLPYGLPQRGKSSI
jgi:hypothetical protein